MKKIAYYAVIGFSALLAASGAQAISRYNALSMTCNAAHAAIAREGAVILRYPSAKVPGMTLYDRYVRNDGYCETHEYADSVTLPTADNPRCPAYVCVPSDDDDDLLFLRPHMRR